MLTISKPALDLITGCKVGNEFMNIITAIVRNMDSKQIIKIYEWYSPLIYIEVVDRTKVFPQSMRFLVSFDCSNGLLWSDKSINKYGVSRKGWKYFAQSWLGESFPYSKG